MRLPSPVFEAVRGHTPYHAAFHFARYRAEWYQGDVAQKPFRDARHLYDKRKFVDEEGSGEEFLVFHRYMIRHYLWTLANTPNHTVRFDPWKELPEWLQAKLGKEFIAAMRAKIAELINSGTLDDLGGFIEGTRLGMKLGEGAMMHDLSHGHVANKELKEHPDDQRMLDASMREMHQAPHNEFFWRLHGWIDNLYAEWQKAHKQTVDVSPLKPTHDHKELPEKFRPKHGAKLVEATPALIEFQRRLFSGERAWEMSGRPPGGCRE